MFKSSAGSETDTSGNGMLLGMEFVPPVACAANADSGEIKVKAKSLSALVKLPSPFESDPSSAVINGT